MMEYCIMSSYSEYNRQRHVFCDCVTRFIIIDVDGQLKKNRRTMDEGVEL